MPVGEMVLKLQIWDTAGQERFRTLTSSYYRGAHGIIIVYDVTDKESFESVKNWMVEIDRLANDQVCRLIIGNKCDREADRKVTTEQGKELAKHYGVPFVETSAKAALNVEDAFKTISTSIHEKLQKISPKTTTTKSKLKKGATLTEESKTAGCC
eukprot:TRINITY_DN12389_c0_g1_i1.p1 TRINITY_DN12389_c0_g1~~TRINITY_DN12389_c0_g1_i1.p1  ORF type:complete len:155 (-),score=30.57 TRINITY_DN12389_c0_g1_i1:50-514(-)